MIVFGISWFFWLFILEMLVFMYWWNDIMSWRHVMTSRQYLASLYSTYQSCSWAILRLLYKFYANLGCWYQTNHRYYFRKLQRRVMTSRCDVMPSYEIEAILVCLQIPHANWPVSHTYCLIVAYYQAKISKIRFVISWRDVRIMTSVMIMTSIHEVKSSCKY